MTNKTLKEVVEKNGQLLVVPEMTPVKTTPVGKEIRMVYNVKAHYRDSVRWDNGERETLFDILDKGIKIRGLDVDFVSIGSRSVYHKGVCIDTWGANTIDHFELCKGECQGHDYHREIQFYKEQH